MSSKRKGTLYERELFHMFWNSSWAAVRSAGSGSTPLPAPDILAGNKEKLLAIECKAIKSKSKHFKKEEVQQLKTFSETINANPIIAMRFDNIGWFFLDVNNLKENKNGNYTISLNHCKKEGIKFAELIGDYKQSKL
ncbi:Holliday junction resolvase [Candidatus Woesearchaeota archaeon]|nr:Holliday junction resolvase [Candidatus Woesearchaeota archaeon]MBT4321792.1 Holliday junction resolvase [Candidatus Woesearchaeota archaeon]MBT4630599.1 Holliday junction resolvase [Candidatus Woesearchaeota archaeon]